MKAARRGRETQNQAVASRTDGARDPEGEPMLNNIGPAGLILIAIVVLVLFGRGKIAGLMGEVGKGITAFKDGVRTPDNEIEDASESADGTAARDVTPEEASERDNA